MIHLIYGSFIVLLLLFGVDSAKRLRSSPVGLFLVGRALGIELIGSILLLCLEVLMHLCGLFNLDGCELRFESRLGSSLVFSLLFFLFSCGSGECSIVILYQGLDSLQLLLSFFALLGLVGRFLHKVGGHVFQVLVLHYSAFTLVLGLRLAHLFSDVDQEVSQVLMLFGSCRLSCVLFFSFRRFVSRWLLGIFFIVSRWLRGQFGGILLL